VPTVCYSVNVIGRIEILIDYRGGGGLYGRGQLVGKTNSQNIIAASSRSTVDRSSDLCEADIDTDGS